MHLAALKIAVCIAWFAVRSAACSWSMVAQICEASHVADSHLRYGKLYSDMVLRDYAFLDGLSRADVYRVATYSYGPYENLTEKPEADDGTWAWPDIATQPPSHQNLPTVFTRRHKDRTEPWTIADLTFHLVENNLMPYHAISLPDFAGLFLYFIKLYRYVEFEHIRFFLRQWVLETDRQLWGFLDVRDFNPQAITITIRHNDWWYWKTDAQLVLGSCFPQSHIFPASTQAVFFELEVPEGRNDRVASMIDQMRQQWRFMRADGAILSAKGSIAERITWRGKAPANQTDSNGSPVKEANYDVTILAWTPELFPPPGQAPDPRSLPHSVPFSKFEKPHPGMNDSFAMDGFDERLTVDIMNYHLSLQTVEKQHQRWRAGKDNFHHMEKEDL